MATTNPSTAGNKIVGWSTSDKTVATVDAKRKVKGVSGEGVATITVTTLDGGYTATCIVTVTMPVKGITLNKNRNTIAAGGSDQLTASINPTNATNMSVTWASSNTALATVSNTGLVTAVGIGTTKITATTVDSAKTATCNVTVTTSR